MKLFRCYDNRLGPTERRPELYEAGLPPDIIGKCDVIMVVEDTKAPLLQFGEELPEDIGAIDWLFMYRGQLKIIATPFLRGVHYATLPKHFIPIVQHLKALHDKHYVHGDIRAYNMVLDYDESDPNIESTGKLIDFDFGGNVENIENGPKYPSGYEHSLKDGFRMGRPGENITFEHDWHDLGSVIFRLYDLFLGKNTDGKRYLQLNYMRQAFFNSDDDNTIKSMQEAFSALGENSVILPNENPSEFLLLYLNLVQNNHFVWTLYEPFESDLKACNMINANQRNGSKGATGSPKKIAVTETP